MIKLYGGPMSRAFRVMWMLDELGLKYEHVSFDHKKVMTHKSAEYLAINPNGHVPTFVDGDIVMWESFAINLYLASTYGEGRFFGKSPAEQAAIYKWTLWGACEIEGPTDAAGKLRTMMRHDWVVDRYKVVEAALARQPYLAGERFTVADLNVLALLYRPNFVSNDVSSLPRVSDWFARIAARPAYKKIMAARGQ